MPSPGRDRRTDGGRGSHPLRVSLRSPPDEVEAAFDRLSAGGPLEMVLEWDSPASRPSDPTERRLELRPVAAARYARRLPVRRASGVIRYVDVGRIRWIEAANQYVRLHTEDGRFLLRHSMADLESLLSPDRFQRIHRSSIVGLERIVEVWVESTTVRWALLDGGERLPVSQRYWSPLQAALVGI